MEIGPRLDTCLVNQQLPCPVKDLGRLRLSPRTVERQHELTAEALPEGVLEHEPFDLPHETGMPSKRELSINAVFERVEPHLLQPVGLRHDEWLVCQVGIGRPPPEAERLAKAMHRRFEVSGCQCLSGFIAERLKPGHI